MLPAHNCEVQKCKGLSENFRQIAGATIASMYLPVCLSLFWGEKATWHRISMIAKKVYVRICTRLFVHVYAYLCKRSFMRLYIFLKTCMRMYVCAYLIMYVFVRAWLTISRNNTEKVSFLVLLKIGAYFLVSFGMLVHLSVWQEMRKKDEDVIKRALRIFSIAAIAK